MCYPTDAATRSLAVLVLFTLFAGQFWRNLLGWPGFVAVTLALTVTLAVLMTRRRLWKRLPLKRLPRTLLLVGLLMVLSLAWSFYPGATAIGLVAQAATTLAALFLCAALSWPELITALARSLNWILGLSLAFELVVAVFVRQPVLPFFTDYGSGTLPKAFYWSEALLFHGGPIQGIVGNRNLLAFVAVLAIIAVGTQWAQGLRRPRTAAAWIGVAVLTLALTRSATAIGALLLAAAMLGALLLARRLGPARRLWVLGGGPVLLVLALVAVNALKSPILSVLGKSDDLTGRLDIWNAVGELIAQRPGFGWGWVSYWVPWAEPFTDLAVRKGVTYLQAHNAWLDVALQLGIVGLVLFIAFVVGTSYRAWWFAVDRPLDAAGRPRPQVLLTLAPAVLLTALIAQSFFESRLLIEGGWALLIVIAVKTKLDLMAVDLDLGDRPAGLDAVQDAPTERVVRPTT